VASLVRSSEGAAAFSSAVPPLPAEWLCVFDRQIRLGIPRGEETETRPSNVYGLEDEVLITDVNTAEADVSLADDLIANAATDERSDKHKRLAGVSRRYGDLLPARLAHLAGWFGSVADHFAAIWWASGYASLHPQLLNSLEWHLTHRSEFSKSGRRAWRLLLERFRHSPERTHDDGWYFFLSQLKQEGWTPHVLRDFERATQPYLSARRAPGKEFFPPPSDAPLEELSAVVEFDVEYPGYNRDELEVPTEVLPSAFEIVRKGLERAADLLTDIGKQYWRTASFLPGDEPGSRYLDEASKYFHWVRTLFDRLAAKSNSVASDEVRRWRDGEKYFFDKFRIYAWMNPALIPGREVAEGVLRLSEDAFWESSHRRELLHTLRARWGQFGNQMTRQIESRIIKGRERWQDEKMRDHQVRVRTTAATMLGWLRWQGCELSPQALRRLEQLQNQIPDWRDSWVETADYALEGRSGFVATDTTPSVLLDAPLSQIATLVEKHSREDVFAFVEYQPFRGLVQQHPRRALAALSFEMRRGNVPSHLWSSLLSDWPPGTSKRLLAVCAGRAALLPKAGLTTLRHELARWFREHAVRLIPEYTEIAYQLFDRVVGALVEAGADATSSTLGEVSIGGKTIAHPRRTVDHAINSPIGNLTDGLLRVLNVSKPTRGSGIPAGIKSRLELALASPGEGSDHAAIQLARDLKWLFHVDPNWPSEKVVPLFAPHHRLAESAWNGLLFGGGPLPQPQLFALLKPHLVSVFDQARDWMWHHDRATNKLVEFLVAASFVNRRGARYVSYHEVRVLLRKVDDTARAHAVWFLATIAASKQDWESFGRHFVERAWPRESRFQTPAVSKQFAFLAEQSGDQFADVVKVVGPLLVKADGLDMTVHRARERDGESSLASRFPTAMLDLLDRLIPDDPKPLPYGLGELLVSIVEGAPDLRTDPRWRRLRRIAERN
jgi:hypothetical protein